MPASTRRAVKAHPKPAPAVADGRGWWHWLVELGPGLITGAADDDPSGIVTYTQVGAQFGYGMLWTMLFCYPLMTAIQEVSARVGRVTGQGLAGSLRVLYPKPVLLAIIALLLGANIFNLGADIGAMGAAAKLLMPGPVGIWVIGFGALSLLLQVLLPYRQYVGYLKWLTLALFAYVATAVSVGEPTAAALRALALPHIELHGAYLTALVAVLGTTISPYLFFWQASQEAEEVRTHAAQKAVKRAPQQAVAQFARIRVDTYVGMGLSQVVALAIILTAAATLHAHGVKNVQDAGQAAAALRPLAGRFATLIFALGIIGTGLLAVPVLAGSAAYAVGECFHWKASLQKKPGQAVKFYSTIAVASLLGLGMNFIHLSPIKALFWAAVINGVVATVVMIMMMLLAQNKKVMGKFTLPPYLQAAGWLATFVMLLASAAMFWALR